MSANSKAVRHLALLIFESLATACSHKVAQINAGKPSLESREAPCSSVAEIDTSDWTMTADSALGLQLRLPTRYVRKRWAIISEPTGVASADWWRDNGTQTTIELARLPTDQDTGSKESLKQSAAGECSLRTASGLAAMLLYRSGYTYTNGHPTTPFGVRVEWPATHGVRLRFIGVAVDSISRDEQIRIAATVRWSLRDST
jgi:hypothetical protein